MYSVNNPPDPNYIKLINFIKKLRKNKCLSVKIRAACHYEVDCVCVFENINKSMLLTTVSQHRATAISKFTYPFTVTYINAGRSTLLSNKINNNIISRGFTFIFTESHEIKTTHLLNFFNLFNTVDPTQFSYIFCGRTNGGSITTPFNTIINHCTGPGTSKKMDLYKIPVPLSIDHIIVEEFNSLEEFINSVSKQAVIQMIFSSKENEATVVSDNRFVIIEKFAELLKLNPIETRRNSRLDKTINSYNYVPRKGFHKFIIMANSNDYKTVRKIHLAMESLYEKSLLTDSVSLMYIINC